VLSVKKTNELAKINGLHDMFLSVGVLSRLPLLNIP